MPNYTVKNIPESLFEKLKQSSNDNQRSINSEIIFQLMRSLDNKKPKTLDLEEVRRLRAATKKFYLTDEKLCQIRNRGRV